MATERQREEQTISSLVSGIVGDVQNLVRSEIALARAEVKTDLNTAKNAGIALGIGGAILGVGGLLLILALARGLAALLTLPVWAGYAIVGLIFAIIGGIMLYSAQKRLKEVNPVPTQTVETMKENAEWIKDRTSSDRT